MRKTLVTRTIATTNVTVLAINTETAEPCNLDFTLAGKIEDEKVMLKEVKKLIADENIVAAKVVAYSTDEKLYGMTEECFIANAEILPPRSVKTANNEEA